MSRAPAAARRGEAALGSLTRSMRISARHGPPNLLHCSPLLKKSCVRQVVSDRWFPLIQAQIAGLRDGLEVGAPERAQAHRRVLGENE